MVGFQNMHHIGGLGSYDFGVENPVGFYMLGSGQVKCTEFCFRQLGNAEL